MAIAHFGLFNAECFGLTIDAFAGSALVVNRVIKRTVAIEQGAHQPAFLPIRIFDTASALGELIVRTDFACALGEEERTAKALSAKAIGMLEEEDRVHA